MALLYGLLVLFVGISRLFSSIVVLDRAIWHVPSLHQAFGNLRYQNQSGKWVPVDAHDVGVQVHSTVQDYLFKAGMIFFGIGVIIGTSGGCLLAKQALRPIG